MNLSAAQLNHQNHYAMGVELDWVRAAAAMLPPDAIVVMIGAGPGVFMISLLECGRADLWPTVIDLHSCEWIRRHLEFATEEQPSVIPALYRQRMRSVEGFDSYDIGLRWVDGPIDLLIVDGDHMPAGISRDMDAWLDHVATGGIVFFHDYLFDDTPWAGKRVRPAANAEDYPEVKEQVDLEMAIRNWPLVCRVGTAIVFRRA